MNRDNLYNCKKKLKWRFLEVV